MNLCEYNQVKEMTYRQYTQYLQDKYGMAPKAYFHESKVDGHLVAGRVTRGKEGLQCHHICEDLVASLSDKTVASSNDITYQQPENLCYANLLEHLYLHILIAEEQNENEGRILGDGGVNWIVLALNSIYSDPNNSWYSKKIQNPEERGLSYNYNNIITDNKDTYLRLINRYCTSAFIRSKLNKTPEELALGLCHTCKADLNNQQIYDDIMNEAKKTYLFGWNVGAFADLEKYLKDNKSALVHICTGGGKTTTALEYLRIHDCHALVLGPSNTIENSWKNNDNAYYMNYQTFMNCYEEIDFKKYTVIICDEAHHIKAERWGEGVRWAMKNTQVKVIGLTATPTTEQFDGIDEEFEGRICSGLDLAEGIAHGHIYPFDYIQSIYKMEDVKEEFEKYGMAGTQLWNKLNLELNKNPIEKILKDNMRPGVRKIIVFVQNMKDIDAAVEAVKRYDSNTEVRIINSKLDKDHNDDAKKWFNIITDKNVCLVTVSMVNEGAHYEGVNTLIMFRRTNSTTLYLQQLGRIVVTTKRDNPKGVVFDFTNNAENLIYRSKASLEVEIKSSTDDNEEERERAEETIEKIKQVIEERSGKEIIYKDYTQDCVKMLNALNDASNVNSTIRKVFGAFISNISVESFLGDIFDLDAWKEFKTVNKNGKLTAERKPHHAVSGQDAKEYAESSQTDPVVKTTVDASDAERITTAFKLILKRAYNFGAIDFENNAKLNLIIKDKELFKTIVTDVGFKNVELVKDIINDISHDSYIYAVNLD